MTISLGTMMMMMIMQGPEDRLGLWVLELGIAQVMRGTGMGAKMLIVSTCRGGPETLIMGVLSALERIPWFLRNIKFKTSSRGLWQLEAMLE